MAEVSAPHGPPESVRRPNNSEQFRPAPWTYRLPRWQADGAVIPEGGSPHVRHGTAGVRGAARWRRGGGLADRGARAAGDAADRAHGFGLSCGTESSDRRFSATVA